uniref:Uncharacterized protein n=1 Tax=Salix viminalis TaxID=40686 RepID=A0A6N2MNJ7_SALVM
MLTSGFHNTIDELLLPNKTMQHDFSPRIAQKANQESFAQSYDVLQVCSGETRFGEKRTP